MSFQSSMLDDFQVPGYIFKKKTTKLKRSQVPMEHLKICYVFTSSLNNTPPQKKRKNASIFSTSNGTLTSLGASLGGSAALGPSKAGLASEHSFSAKSPKQAHK